MCLSVGLSLGFLAVLFFFSLKMKIVIYLKPKIFETIIFFLQNLRERESFDKSSKLSLETYVQ